MHVHSFLRGGYALSAYNYVKFFLFKIFQKTEDWYIFNLKELNKLHISSETNF